MRGHSDEDDEPYWKPSLDGDDIEPVLPVGRKSFPPVEPALTNPLLLPLARAQNAIARLEAATASSSPAVTEGLRARISYREAAGWLAHVAAWIHPNDLALHDAGLTGNYIAAARLHSIKAELPSTAAIGVVPETPQPLCFERHVTAALSFARHWRRLSEFKTWNPLATAAAVRETVDALQWTSCSIQDEDIEAWLAPLSARDEIPDLIAAGQAGRDWMNTHVESDPLAFEAIFLVCCVWHKKGFGRSIGLPFWSASAYRHHCLSSAVGIPWLIRFLDCVAEAAQTAHTELQTLRRFEEKASALKRTARSHLPAAIDIFIRAPVVTARALSRRLTITHQAALGLLKPLLEAQIVKESTGRAAWRAFTAVS